MICHCRNEKKFQNLVIPLQMMYSLLSNYVKLLGNLSLANTFNFIGHFVGLKAFLVECHPKMLQTSFKMSDLLFDRVR